MKRYLGDGAYVDFDGYALILTAENGITATDRIVLEPSVYFALVDYVALLRGEIPKASSAGDATDAEVKEATESIIDKVRAWGRAHGDLDAAGKHYAPEMVDMAAVHDAESVCEARYGELFDAVRALMRRGVVVKDVAKEEA